MPAAQDDDAASATADANGRAAVRLGPGSAHEVWNVVGYSVRATGTTYAEVRVYEGGEADEAFFDSTYDGTNASSPQAPGTLVLWPGDFLTFVWSLADPGARCTARIRFVREGM